MVKRVSDSSRKGLSVCGRHSSSRRTIHQGWGPGTRLAQPVCWEPRVRRGPDALVRKAEMCLRGFPSTHWASLGFLHDFMTEFITDDDARLVLLQWPPCVCLLGRRVGKRRSVTFVLLVSETSGGHSAV